MECDYFGLKHRLCFFNSGTETEYVGQRALPKHPEAGYNNELIRKYFFGKKLENFLKHSITNNHYFR